MTNLNIHNETNINAKGTHTKRCNKPVICIDTGVVFASMTDAAEHIGATIDAISNCIRGVQKTAKGYRFCLVSKVTENISEFTAQIAKLNEDAEDARKWREYQAEQDAIRRAEEDRLREAEEREFRIRKLAEKLERRNARINAIQEQLRQAIERRDETARELDEFNEVEEVA